jgi:pyruvate ferredoxin oxidoreductase gamma subunit
VSFCRISDSPITVYDQVTEPDVVIVADPSVLSSVDVAAGLKKGGTVIANCACQASELGITDAKVHAVDGTRIALERLKRPVFNTVMLGAFVKVTGMVKMESVEKAIRQEFGGKDREIADRNIEAVRACYELAGKG